MKFVRQLMLPMLVLLTACATTQKVDNRDYYRELTTQELNSALRREGVIPWRRYRGPSINSNWRVLSDWKQGKINTSVGAFACYIQDDGIIYDTTVGLEGVIRFGKKGFSIEVSEIHKGDWAFSGGFTEAAASLAVISTVAGAGVRKMAESSPPPKVEARPRAGEWSGWYSHSPALSGGKHREARVFCPNGRSFEVEEWYSDSGSHWFQRDSGEVLTPTHHGTLEEFGAKECAR